MIKLDHVTSKNVHNGQKMKKQMAHGPTKNCPAKMSKKYIKIRGAVAAEPVQGGPSHGKKERGKGDNKQKT